jgi:hypothetical protein
MICRGPRISALAEFVLLTAKPPAQSMIVSSFGQIAPISAHDHETGSSSAGRAGYVPGRVLHLVTDSLPTTSAGYGVPYHRLLPWRMPAGPAAGPSTRGLELADGLTRQRASSELYQRNRELETQCMLAADLVVALGEAMRDEIEARGVPAEKVEIVPNAVSAEFLRPLPDATTLRAELEAMASGLCVVTSEVKALTEIVKHEVAGMQNSIARSGVTRRLP